jgi:2-C-methyl-D-erythritol 2,4-cyclodiphosphate synthase
MRIGIGQDVHRLVPGRNLVIGGIVIPYEKGLLGHSDADVLIHAAIDALLGAAGLGDIGMHFPDTDEVWKNISSLILLGKTGEMIRESGHEIVNLDATVIAQHPRLSPFRQAMAARMAEALGVPETLVNIKFTTTERLGFIGDGLGMAAECVALITRTNKE